MPAGLATCRRHFESTDPELSASYLARLYLLARTSPSFEGLWWYDFQDDGWNRQYNEDNFGLVRPDLTPKPGYYAIGDISDTVAKGEYMDRLWAGDEELWILGFRVAGEDRWAVWSADDSDRQIILETASPESPLRIQQVGHDAYTMPWGFRDWSGRHGEFAPNRLSLVVGHRPVLISGNLSGVSVVEVVPRLQAPAEGSQAGES
jgi:hypothetical protein